MNSWPAIASSIAVISLMACSTSSTDTSAVDANTDVDAMSQSLDSQVSEMSDSGSSVMDAQVTQDAKATLDAERLNDAAREADTAVANDAQPASDMAVTASDAGTRTCKPLKVIWA